MTLIDSSDTSNFFNLDTIGFGRLVENARSQIPRFAPEWTDHNLHDPGMTIIDLLAWVVDQQIYRLGFVSDRHLSAFAALLGVRPTGPTAASGLVWPDASLPAGLLLAAKTKLRPLPQSDIEFVTERDVLLSVAELTDTALIDGDGRRPLSFRRGGSSTTLELADDTVMVLGFDEPLASGIGGPISVGFDVDSSAGSEAAGDRPGWGPLIFEYRIGDDDWNPVDVLFDQTAALGRSGVVQLEIPAAEGQSGRSELRLRFDRGFFPLSPSLRQVSLNVLSVVQHQIEEPRKLSDGTGGPDQLVIFDRSGLVSAPTILVDDEEWIERDDFCESGPEDPHYVLTSSGAKFGNGLNGRRPPLKGEIRIGRTVRTAGAAGNIRADVSWELVPPGGGAADPGTGPYLGFRGRSCVVFSGGSAAPTAVDLVAAARTTATRRQNLLTDEDLSAAALSLAGFAVARADVLAGYDPSLPERFAAGTRSLVVFPLRAPDAEIGPVPPRYLESIASALAPQRLLGERLLVMAPAVVEVDVQLTVVVTQGYRPDDVAAAVRTTIARHLSVLGRRGPDGETISPWPLGRPVSVVEVKALAADVAGVMFVSDCAIGQSGELGDSSVTLARHGVAVAGRVEIEANVARPGQGGKRQ